MGGKRRATCLSMRPGHSTRDCPLVERNSAQLSRSTILSTVPAYEAVTRGATVASAFLHHVEGPAQLVLADDQWRLHAQHVALLAAHADQHAALATDEPHSCGLGRRRLLFHEARVDVAPALLDGVHRPPS